MDDEKRIQVDLSLEDAKRVHASLHHSAVSLRQTMIFPEFSATATQEANRVKKIFEEAIEKAEAE